MDKHLIERTAMRLTHKYGKKALPKAVEVARYYLEQDDDEAAKRWIEIGYAIRTQQTIRTVKEIVEAVDEDSEKIAEPF